MMNPLYFMNMLNQFNQFRNQCNLTPQQAQQQVQQMMQDNPALRNQYEQYANTANQLLAFMGMRR